MLALHPEEVPQLRLVASQVLPRAQVAHAAPPVPQAVLDVPAWQTPAESQHPVWHVCALHGPESPPSGMNEPSSRPMSRSERPHPALQRTAKKKQVESHAKSLALWDIGEPPCGQSNKGTALGRCGTVCAEYPERLGCTKLRGHSPLDYRPVTLFQPPRRPPRAELPRQHEGPPPGPSGQPDVRARSAA